MRRITRPIGALAAIGLAVGLTLAGQGTASATASCPAWPGGQAANPVTAAGGDAFSGMAVVPACDVWMVGRDITADSSGNVLGQTLIERWTGGQSWAVVPSPSPDQAPDRSGLQNYLSAVAAASSADAWAVGVTGGHGMLLHWDGSSWTQVTTAPDSSRLTAVSVISANDVGMHRFRGRPYTTR